MATNVSPGQALSGLMDQLQTFESSFTTILFEIAMKLTSLTDTNVFLLVEGKAGRKFSGNPELCNEYLKGQLRPRNADVELEFDPNLTSVREKMHRPFPRGNFEADSQTLYRETSFAGSNFRKRTPESHPSGTVVEKKAKLAKIENDSCATSPDVYCEGDETAVGWPPSEDHRRGSSAFEDSPFSGFTLDLPKETNAEAEADDQRHSPDIIEDGTFAPNSGNLSMISNRFVVLDATSGALVPLSQDVQMSPNPSTFQRGSFPHLDVCRQKLQALQSMAPEQVFFKGTIGNRVLMSVMYEFGRSIADRCKQQGLTSPKDPAARIILNQLFDGWINENLPHLYGSNMKPDQVRTAPGFLKHLARMNFYCCFRKQDKSDKTYTTLKKTNIPL